MGKATGIFTNFTGKVANVVGYVATNKSGKKQQMLRGYQSEVKNPKSIGQAVQRMKMKPIMNLYRALKSIIDRGFEGVKYGDMSRRKFMKLAMNDFVGPYLQKGDNRAVPAALIITSGSLPEMPGKIGANPGVELDINIGNETSAELAELSTALINSGYNILDGDQLTFVGILKNGNNFLVYEKSFVINSQGSSDPVAGFVTDEGKLVLDTDGRGEIMAAGVILSRQGEGGAMNLRSTCRLTLNTNELANFYTQDAFMKAALSYMSNGETLTDWPEVEFEANIPAGTAIGALPSGSVTPANAVGTNALGYVTKGGQKGWYYKTTAAGKQALDADGNLLTVMVESVATPVVFADSFTNIYPATV